MTKLISIIIFLIAFQSDAQYFDYVKQFGGTSGWDESFKVITDASGSIYQLGSFSDTSDIDPGPGTDIVYDYGTFLEKLDSLGNYIWAIRFKYLVFTQGSGFVIDNEGNIILGGYYNYDFVDVDPDPAYVYYLDPTPCGSIGACGANFILKLDNAGHFVWAKSFVPYDNPNPLAIHAPSFSDLDVDKVGNVYAAGYFYDSLDFDPGLDTFNLVEQGGVYGDVSSDLYVVKLDFDGNFVWARQFIGPSQEIANALKIDKDGNIVMGGILVGAADVDPGPGVFTIGITASGLKGEMFVSKLSAAGDFIWAKVFDNPDQQNLLDLDVDNFGNIYACGWVLDTVDFDPDTTTSYFLNPVSGGNDFVFKLDSAGVFVWAEGGGAGSNNCIDVDMDGNVFTSGEYNAGMDLDPTTGVYYPICDGNSFIRKLKSNGDFVWARAYAEVGLVSGAEVHVYSINADLFNNIYLSGTFNTTTDFNPNAGVFSVLGWHDIYLLKLNQEGEIGLEINSPDVINENVSIYPNPANSFITISTSNIADKIYLKDIFGRTIKTFQPNSTQTTMDLQNVESGIYFVNVVNGNLQQTVKIVKQ